MDKTGRANTYRKQNVNTPLGTSSAYALNLSGLNCRLGVLAETETPEDMRIDGKRMVRFSFPYGTDIIGSDKIQFDGVYYTVSGIRTPTTGVQSIMVVMGFVEDEDFLNKVVQG